jgi:hypothetical protein
MGRQQGKQQVVVYLPNASYRRLKLRSAREGLSMSALVDRDLAQRTLPNYPVRPLSRTPESDLSPAAAALVAYGAPLFGPGETSVSLEEAVAMGVAEARKNVALPRLLVVVILKNRTRIRWEDVRKRLPVDDLRVLGVLVELAAAVSGDEMLRRCADDLHDTTESSGGEEPFPTNPAFARYARCMGERTPKEMRRWGFVSATPLDDYADAARKFCCGV